MITVTRLSGVMRRKALGPNGVPAVPAIVAARPASGSETPMTSAAPAPLFRKVRRDGRCATAGATVPD